MTDERRDWLDLPPEELARVWRETARELGERANDLAEMQRALRALARHPEAATAREACQRECLLSSSRLVA